MKKVLITGIGGFAGSHLRDFLSKQKDLEIFGTDLKTSSNGNVKIFSVDLTDGQKTQELVSQILPDLVFHLAALTSPAKSFAHPFDTMENNIKAEINLLEAVKNEKLKARILIIGSADEYGLVKPEENPVSENQPLNPTSPYAVSKIAQDFLALQYALAYKMDIVRVRPFNHIGPRQSPNFVVSAFAKQIAEIEKGKKEAVLKVGNLSAARDFTDVCDMMEAYFLATTEGKPGEVYNLGSGKSFTMKEILNILLSYTTKKIKIQVDRTLLRPVDNPILVCNAAKFNRLTGWKAKIPLRETLLSVLNYWREQ